MATLHIPAYDAFIPPNLRAALWAAAEPVAAVPGLRIGAGLRERFPDVECDEALALVAAVFRAVHGGLDAVLQQRVIDRAFVDRVGRELATENHGRDFTSPQWRTVLGEVDDRGRIVVGPLPGPPAELRPISVPAFLKGDQVTLFGPPGAERLCINAMNALHRRRPDEPPIVEELLHRTGSLPRWGADDEDSKTPLMEDVLAAARNLRRCFEGDLEWTDPRTGRHYALAESGRSQPIKRVPGLALPDGNHLLDGEPVPLHLYDFVTHLWTHRHRPEALVFYVPKLEDEGEALYLRRLIDAAEAECLSRDPSFVPGHTRVLLVFENPRAIFRIREMAAALGPAFLGGSLGWHDFLASTARLFRTDPGYRIPVKADPAIVVHRIRESHRILARTLADTGAMRIGGMYGVLYEDGHERSYRLSLRGFVRDVVTQLRRGLDGFWVAHPDFVRIGLALVAAFRAGERGGDFDALRELVRALLPDHGDQSLALSWIDAPDEVGLDPADPRYPRAVLAADLATSTVIANDDPEEVRYNLFQALQYLADWLCGNGCVALPATLKDDDGTAVFVRIMDDLATTERSRWEVWAEVHHGRVPEAVARILLDEELRFLRAGQDEGGRRIQVRWQGEAARWYPVAGRVLERLIFDAEPVEFVTELLLPFTFPCIRDAEDPWATAASLCGWER